MKYKKNNLHYDINAMEKQAENISRVKVLAIKKWFSKKQINFWKIKKKMPYYFRLQQKPLTHRVCQAIFADDAKIFA